VSLEIQIITDLSIIMVVAAFVTFVFHKLRQPLILGYIIAGIIIGPYTPPSSLISQPDFLQVGAELGVILLLFGIGLEFPLSKLRKVGKVSVGVASIEIVFMILSGYGLGYLLGLTFIDGTFLGVALASSSTVIIAKVLADLGRIREESSTIMLGVLVVEDLIVVLLLAILESVVSAGSLSSAVIGWDIAKIGLFVGGTLAIGGLIIPRAIDKVAEIKREEVLILAAVGLCFGLAIVGNQLGFSVAIGAFLTGVVVASSKASEKIVHLIAPLKDVFGALFFVSVGALINIGEFQTFLLPALLVTAIMVASKVAGCGLGTKLFGYDNKTSLRVGLGMAQIGEFAFIVMAAGLQLNVIGPLLYPSIGIAVAITAFLTPYLIKFSFKIR
jgi:CPA2 family monovalent cation:H+ antiporter-2